MKKVIASLLLVASANAFAGYTAEVCQTNEAGISTSCRLVYFNRDLGQNTYQAPQNCSGEAQDTACDKPGAHVPTLIGKISKFFTDRGFKVEAQSNDYAGGN